MRGKAVQRKQTITKRIQINPRMIKLNPTGEIVIQITAIKERLSKSLKSTNFSFDVKITIEEKIHNEEMINFEELRKLFSHPPPANPIQNAALAPGGTLMLENSSNNVSLSSRVILPRQLMDCNWLDWARINPGVLTVDSLLFPRPRVEESNAEINDADRFEEISN
jgi:hypothetical protein